MRPLCRSSITLLLISAATHFANAEATTAPASQPTYEPGLSMAIYKLPRVPKRVRKLLPGQVPDAVHKLDGLRTTRESFHGLDGNIQAEITGELLADIEGDYTFEIESDDGLELWIDDTLAAKDAWVNGSSQPTVVTVPLTPGWHPIRVAFYQGDGGIGFRIRVKPARADTYVDVPIEALRHDATARAELKAKAEAPPTTQTDTPWRTLYKTGGFANLPEDRGDLLVDLLEGPTQISRAARREWANLSKATNYDTLPYWQQTMVASGFLDGWYFGQTHREHTGERAAYSLSQPEPLVWDGWNGAKRDGFVSTLTIDDRTIKLYTPAADSAERVNAADAIAGLPLYLRQYLREIKVEPYGTASEFNGGGGTIWIRMRKETSRETLDNVFAHEAGHLLMNATDCYNRWVEAIAKDTLSVSHYGRQNPSEDFADFTRLYVSTNDEAAQLESLRTLYPHRMKLMEELVAQAKATKR
jgi:hypothetical protein